MPNFLLEWRQGDVLVSEALATIFARQADRDGGPNRLAACFIHQVPTIALHSMQMIY